MFDVGFSEILVIGVVALVVIGPERLPTVARTIGALLGRAQRYFNEVKSEVSRELELDELKRMRDQAEAQLRAVEQRISGEAAGLGNTIHAPAVAAPKAEDAAPGAEPKPVPATASEPPAQAR